MYQRLKQSIYRKDTEDTHELEDVKIDKLEDADGDACSDADNNKKYNISNKFSTIIKSFASYITSGVSKSWFITSNLIVLVVV